jgi:hypothetical protein
MDVLLPATQLNYSLPDLHRLPVLAQTHLHRKTVVLPSEPATQRGTARLI